VGSNINVKNHSGGIGGKKRGGRILGLKTLSRACSLLITALTAAVAWGQANPSLKQMSLLVEEEPVFSEDLKGELNFSLTGRRYNDALVNSRWGRGAVGVDLKKKLSDSLQGRFAIEQRFTSGAASNYYSLNDGNAGASSMLLDEFSLTYKPRDFFKASGGIINVGLNPVHSSMGSQSWFAGKLEGSLRSEGQELSVQVSQATPSSGGVSNRAVDQDTLPLFTQGTLMAQVTPSDRLRLRAAYTGFIFTDPSSRTAEDSRTNGSTVLGNGPYLFAHEFKGSEIAAEAKITLFLDDELTFKTSQVLNEKAPLHHNLGFGWRTEYRKKYDRFEVTAAFNGFRLESDAIPSAYGIDFNGFTNRKGLGASLKVTLPKQHLGFFASYGRANVLDRQTTASGTQADREIYTVRTEIDYDIF
jgi:hypothetical protein